MDAVIFGIIAVVLTFMILYGTEEETSSNADNFLPEDATRSTKLNDNFYEDPNAFTEISSALGFPKSR